MAETKGSQKQNKREDIWTHNNKKIIYLCVFVDHSDTTLNLKHATTGETGMHAGLYASDADDKLSVSGGMHVWLDGGAPAEKLVLGLARDSSI